MKFSKGILSSVACGFLLSQAALAGQVNLNITADNKRGTFESTNKMNSTNNFHSTGYTFDLGYQAVESLPLAVGAFFSTMNMGMGEFTSIDNAKPNTEGNAWNNVQGNTANNAWEAGIALTAWMPQEMTGMSFLRPYAKVGYAFSNHTRTYLQASGAAETEAQTKDVELTGTNNGLTVAVGNSMHITDSVSALLQYTYDNRTADFSNELGENAAATTKQKLVDNRKNTAHGVSFGLSVNI